MDAITPSIPATDWTTDPASALTDTISALSGVAHAHPILGWIGVAYLGLLLVGKKVPLPEPWASIVHLGSNILWMLTSSKVQNQTDVKALTHSESLGILTSIMHDVGGNATVQELVSKVSVSVHEPYRSEILKMLADPAPVIAAIAGVDPTVSSINPANPAPTVPLKV